MEELLPHVSEVTLHYKAKVKPSQMPKIKFDKDVVRLVKNMSDMQDNIEYRELFYVLYLNQGGRVLSLMKVSEGGISSTIVDVRMILQGALLLSATSIILVHNHPSGSVLPSEEDKRLTNNIQQAASLLNIRLLDSIIISEEENYSFTEEGLI